MTTDARDYLYGSHIPALIDVLSMTTGPVAEIGCGFYSTPLLHWWCWSKRRHLVSFEESPEFYEWATQFACEYHEVHLVQNWDEIDLSPEWSVVLVDHDVRRRITETSRLRHAEYVVVHDTQQRRIAHGRRLRGYRFKKTYKCPRADTMVLSNMHDVERILT